MIRYLIKRPVAVFSIVVAVLILGWVAMKQLPVSLLPDIEIPRISIRVNYSGHSAEEIENNIVKPLRNALTQTAHLKDMKTLTQDGSAVLQLFFDFGTPTSYAFLDVNEKIDATLDQLPKDLPFPKVIKATAGDVPVYNLLLTNQNPRQSFLALSDFAREVIKKRIEQLPDVALADMSGDDRSQIILQIKPEAIANYQVTPQFIKRFIKQHNYMPGSLTVQNGIYQYHLKFEKNLNTVDDLKNLPVNIRGKLFKLKDLADITKQASPPKGNVSYKGQKAISFLIIKQADAKISRLKKQVYRLINDMQKEFPQLQFHVEQDQSKLIAVSLNNLKSSLIIGTVLAALLMFIFFKDWVSPVVIAVSMPLSLIIAFLFLHLFHLSLNIISLSGLVLGVGMMIDNAIIVIDSIQQKLRKHTDLDTAVVQGTNEVIAPLISSMLTTVSVFLPLIYLSGITGALFYDQAVSVSAGLMASLLVSFFVIPVLYKMLYRFSGQKTFFYKGQNIEKYYQKTHDFFIKRKLITLIIALTGIAFMFLFFKILPKSKLPAFNSVETTAQIDWGENIQLKENQRRIDSLLLTMNEIDTYIAWNGQQNYLLQNEAERSPEQSKIYIKTHNIQELKEVKQKIKKTIKSFDKAKINFLPANNLFEYIFADNQPQLGVKLYANTHNHIPALSQLEFVRDSLGLPTSQIKLMNSLQIHINPESLALFQVDYNNLINTLQSAVQSHYIDHLKSAQKYIPVVMSYPKKDLTDIINQTTIINRDNQEIPLRILLHIQPAKTYKFIHGDLSSHFLFFKFDKTGNPISLMQKISQRVKNFPAYSVRFSGRYFLQIRRNKEMLSVIFIALMLLYFIMLAQFENFWQPFIILLEIPIDIGFGLLFIYLFGHSINIMVIIGIVVMSGVVVNDSILKIYTINMLRKKGLAVDNAIEQAGTMRFKAILMTSLTTILALLPFLFMDGLGAELQKPLALMVIGSMLFGTFVSLYFVPLAYKAGAKIFNF